MKKILCAITSQQNSDIDKWRILNADKDFSEYQYHVCEDLLFVINGSSTGNYFDQGWKYKELAKKIVDIVNDDSIAILFHGASKREQNQLMFELKQNKDDLNIIGIESFSTRGDGNYILERYIEPFIIEKDKNKQKSKFDLLIEKIEKKSPEDRVNEAMALRSQLLTPLVALDWIKQMSAPECKIKISDPKAISETKEAAIKAFNESISEKQDSDILKYIFTIKEFEKIKKDISEKDGAITHEDLKNFASAIETHIEQMQQ